MEEKEKILRALGGIPPAALVMYVSKGVVTIPELEANGLSNYPEKYEYVKNHAAEAEQNAKAAEDIAWNEAKKQGTEASLVKYKTSYPSGRYISECDGMLADMPWANAVRTNTIDGYNIYMRQHPGKHTADALAAIERIEDERDWAEADRFDTKEKYGWYKEKHPNGNYVSFAEERINRPLGEKDLILESLKQDDNAYSAFELQRKIGNHILKWSDLESVFSFEKIQAIQDWTKACELPPMSAPKDFVKDSTEVYFWGTKGTGKTCVLGSILSAAKQKGILEPQSCKARLYLDQLSNIFTLTGNTGICNLPLSTPSDSVSEMVIKLEDEKHRQHKMTLVDLAGEAVTGIYKKRNGLPLLKKEEEAVDHIMHYLSNQYNNKIHFFVLEYGSAGKFVETDSEALQITQCNVLQDLALFLKEKKCIQESTVGAYILITKSDKIDAVEQCEPSERPKYAYDYVKKNFPSFFTQLKKSCAANKVSEFKTISYSIGDVFAQNLCEFNPSDSDKIIQELLRKTRPEYSCGFLERLLS